MVAKEHAYTYTNDVLIRSLKSGDIPEIYRISFNVDTQYLWMPDEKQPSLNKFSEKLARRVAYRWEHCYVFEQRLDNKILGFAYCYNDSVANSTASLAVCVDSPFLSSLVCLRSLYLYISHLFIDHNYRKLYAEVYAYNQHCIQLLEKLGFMEEGCLREHQLWNEQYWDQHIYAISKENYRNFCSVNTKLVEKLSCKHQKN